MMRLRVGKFIAFVPVSALAFAAIWSTPTVTLAATQPDTPPLGILIAPEGEAPPPITTTPTAPTERPLGVLLGPGANVPVVSPALPETPFPAPTPTAAPEPNLHQPAPEQSQDRPLGVLMGQEPAYVAPAIPERQPILSPAPVAQPQRDSLPPAPGASADRPLGTLFNAPDGNATANTPPPGPTIPSSGFRPTQTSTPADTAPAADEPPVRFVADEMSFDREKNLITATGNVQITHEDRTLFADRIIYDQDKDVVSALGHVVMREPTGERLFGDRMEISGDMKDAVIHNVGLILQDRSRVAGVGARRSGGKMTELRKAVYSPCEPCLENPNAPPLWQIKAVRVIHDKDEKIIEYRDAWIEMFGYPVAYTPYFRHPDPTVKRQSGFLFPRFGNSSDFGTILETPYFWAISDYEDATIRPILMTDAAPVLALQYRNRLQKGEINLEGSVTANDYEDYSTEKGELGMRGYIDAEGRFDINRTWRWGFDLERATDDTFMRRYGFGAPQSLNSQAFVEGFRGSNYFSAKTLVFQGLQETDSIDSSPIVLPLVDYNHMGKRDRLGGRFLFDFNFLALTRSEGSDTRRVALHPRWERSFGGPFGSLYRFQAGLNADFYHVNSLARDNKENFSGVSYRLFPYTNLEWRMPLVKTQGTVRQILEPIASIAMAPNGGNSDKIPNEDSTDFEFDETNLFSINRFSGIDRVEGGPRMNYGLKWGLYGEQGGSTTAFVGQTYRPRSDTTFGAGSGLEDNLSDIVASVKVTPGRYLSAYYRSRFASDNFAPNRNELTMTVGVPAFTVSGQYAFLEQQADSEFDGREELNMSVSSVINRYWRANFSAVRDLQADEMRTASLSATYEDECFIFLTRLARTFYEDRDLKPTDALTFHLVFKTIGEVKSGASLSSN